MTATFCEIIFHVVKVVVFHLKYQHKLKNKGNIKIFRYVKTYLWEFFGFLVVLACPPFLKVAELKDFDLQLSVFLNSFNFKIP